MSTSTTPAVGPDQPDPIRDIKAALEGREGWHDLSAKVQRKGDTLLIAGLCVTPPAEAQAQGGGEVVAVTRHDAGFPPGPLFDPDAWDRLRALPKGTRLYTAHPSAPVGVDGIAREAVALALDEAGCYTEANNVRRGIDLDEYRVELSAARIALAQQPAAVDGADRRDATVVAGGQGWPQPGTREARG